jgi:hypothetical protein
VQVYVVCIHPRVSQTRRLDGSLAPGGKQQVERKKLVRVNVVIVIILVQFALFGGYKGHGHSVQRRGGI